MNLLKQIFSVKNEYKNNRKYKVVTIFGIKIKRFIENTLSQKPIETPKEPVNPVQYLEKYLYILNENVDTETKEADFCKNPPVIWQMWWNGEGGRPPIVNVCLDKVKKMYPEQQIVITENNYSDYIDIPQFILDKHKQGIIPNAHFSDVIRLLLLCKYGGVWIDATCLLTSEIPNEIMSSELFYFKSRIWGEWPFVPSKALLNPLVGHLSVFEGYITGSSWFIVAKKNNYILEKTKQMLLEYWKNENSLVDYFTFHYIMSLIIINDRKAKEIYEKMINKNNVIPHLLQGRLPWDWDKDIYEEVKTFSFIHKLTYYMNLEQAKENPKSFYNKIIEFNSKTNDR